MRINPQQAASRITGQPLGKRRAKGTNSLFSSDIMIYDIDNDKVY